MVKRNKKRGFTIVELLIVIVVIAILTAIVTVSYSGIQKRATASVMQETLRDIAKLFVAKNIKTQTYPDNLPGSISVPDAMGLALSQVSTTSEFCLNITSSRYNDLLWHTTQDLVISEGLCSGEVIVGSIIGDYTGTVNPPPSAAVIVEGDGGGLTAETSEDWSEVTISWNEVAGSSRYELQLSPTGTSTWYLRRINGETAANSNAGTSYQNNADFSAQIPPSETSITWHGSYAMPLTALGSFQYRVRAYDGSNTPGAWNTVTLNAPDASSLTTFTDFQAHPDSSWEQVNLAWTVPANNVPAPVIEIQLRDQSLSAWYLRRINGETAANSNADMSYQNDTDFSAQIPTNTTTVSWHGSYAIPKTTGKTFEYRIRFRSSVISGLYSDWKTISLVAPTASDYSAVPSLTTSVSGTGDTSTVTLTWSHPQEAIPGLVYELQLKNSSSTTWYIRRIADSYSNGNAPLNASYLDDPAFSALIPSTTTSQTWHGTYAVPQTGQTFDYRIRQRSTTVSGLYSDWTTIQLSR